MHLHDSMANYARNYVHMQWITIILSMILDNVKEKYVSQHSPIVFSSKSMPPLDQGCQAKVKEG